MSPPRGVGDLAILREEQDGEWIAIGLPARRGELHAAFEGARNHPHEGDPVACCGSMFAWTLKMKPVTSSRLGAISPLGRLRARRRGIARQRVDQLGDPEILQRRAEIDRVRSPSR